MGKVVPREEGKGCKSSGRFGRIVVLPLIIPSSFSFSHCRYLPFLLPHIQTRSLSLSLFLLLSHSFSLSLAHSLVLSLSFSSFAAPRLAHVDFLYWEARRERAGGGGSERNRTLVDVHHVDGGGGVGVWGVYHFGILPSLQTVPCVQE